MDLHGGKYHRCGIFYPTNMVSVIKGGRSGVSEAGWRSLYGRSDMDTVNMLHFIHDKHAFNGAEAFNCPQYIEDELLVIFHIRGMDFQQIVEAARYVVALGHLRDILHDTCKISRFIRRSFTLQNTTNPRSSFPASSTAIYFFIYPPSSSLLSRSNTGVDERRTFAASSLTVSRAFSCNVRSICMSTWSSFLEASIVFS